MADIIDREDIDKDTLDATALEEQFTKHYKLLADITLSKNLYITKLHGSRSFNIVLGQSDNSIEVHKLHKNTLSKVCRLSGHQKSLSEVVFSPLEDYLLYSAGLDGLVKLWDTRTSGSCVQEYKDPDEELMRPYDCMDVSCNGRVLCAGSQLVQDDAYIVFWDQRVPTPLGGYWNSHTDDITQVKFHTEKNEILTSGSLDGLLNVYNIMEETEDDALQYSLNVENSVERINWLDENTVSCVTQSNDLQVWDVENGDLLKTYTRDKIARSIKRSKEDDCYVVDAYTTLGGSQMVLAGSYGEDGHVLRTVTVAGKKLKPSTNFTENKQVVRCCWYEKERDILVTAGEDGVVNVWAGNESTENNATSVKLSKKINKLHVKRHKPY